MTNFFLLSEKAQQFLAEKFASQNRITVEDAFVILRAAGEKDRKRLEEMQLKLKLEEEKAKRIFDSEKIQDGYEESLKEEIQKRNDEFKDISDRLQEHLKERGLKDTTITGRDSTGEQKKDLFDDNFTYRDAFGNIITVEDEDFFKPTDNSDIVNTQQKNFILRAQERLFKDALSRGSYNQLTAADLKKAQELRLELDEIKKSEKFTISKLEQSRDIEIQEINIKIKDRIKETQLFFRKHGYHNTTLGGSVNIMRQEMVKRQQFWSETIRNAKLLFAEQIKEIETPLLQLENQVYSFNRINEFREKIIIDIEGFRGITELTNTDRLVLEQLIEQGSQFINNALRFGVDISAADMQELQLAILDAVNILKTVGMEEDDFFKPRPPIDDDFNRDRDKIDGGGNIIDDIFKGADDLFGGIGDIGKELGKAFEGLFNPPQDDLTALFVKTAIAQQRAAKALESGNFEFAETRRDTSFTQSDLAVDRTQKKEDTTVKPPFTIPDLAVDNKKPETTKEKKPIFRHPRSAIGRR